MPNDDFMNENEIMNSNIYDVNRFESMQVEAIEKKIGHDFMVSDSPIALSTGCGDPVQELSGLICFITITRL